MINIRYSAESWSNKIDAIQVISESHLQRVEYPFRFLVRSSEGKIIWRIMNDTEPGGKTEIYALFKSPHSHQSNILLSREKFLEKVREYSEEDFFFLLWHPEIFQGNFLPTKEEWNGYVSYP
jgi:hypothetical protein